MQDIPWAQRQDWGLRVPVRNRYFHGKLLDVYHFDLETAYHSDLRKLLNRLVAGYGVLCGLDVEASDDGKRVAITAGTAIDKIGRVIIKTGKPTHHAIPPDVLPAPDEDNSDKPARQKQDEAIQQKPPEEEQEAWVTVAICYRECPGDPTPILAGDCTEGLKCAPGSIYEKYEIVFWPGRQDPFPLWECEMPDWISGGKLDYAALATWVSDSCPEYELADPCIPLANLHLVFEPDGQKWRIDGVDITIRPIVFTNDLIFRLIMSLLIEAPKQRRSK
jgi:hypothetical protein